MILFDNVYSESDVDGVNTGGEEVNKDSRLLCTAQQRAKHTVDPGVCIPEGNEYSYKHTDTFTIQLTRQLWTPYVLQLSYNSKSGHLDPYRSIGPTALLIYCIFSNPLHTHTLTHPPVRPTAHSPTLHKWHGPRGDSLALSGSH